MWELWEAASGGVQTKYRLVHLCEDDESWQAACTTLGEFLELELQAAVRPTWSKVEAIFSALLFVICGFALILGTWTGRFQLSLFTVLVVAGSSVWLFLHFGKQEMPAQQVVPKRSRPRLVENVGSDKTDAQMPSELMQSLASMAGQTSMTEQVSSKPLWQPVKGQVVKVKGESPYADFADEVGVVTGSPEGLIDVKLLSRALLFSVPPSSLVPHRSQGDEREAIDLLVAEVLSMSDAKMPVGQSDGIQETSQVYAPLSRQSIELVQEQSKIIKAMLVKWSARSALLPSWPQRFWQEVHGLKSLDPRVLSLLKTHGYLGDGKGTPPRVLELKEKLGELEASGALSHSTALFDLGADASWQEEEGDDEGWESTLPPDLKRAGPEIFASFKSAGAKSARDWLNQMIPLDKRNDPTYVDLFNQASLVDFVIKDARGNHTKALNLIATSDTAEVALRRLASYVHERRTGDRDAAISMLAIKPTNLSHDIAPSWLVSEASVFSQSEYKRRERAKTQRGSGSTQFQSSEKGKGRGKTKKKQGVSATKPATQG